MSAKRMLLFTIDLEDYPQLAKLAAAEAQVAELKNCLQVWHMTHSWTLRDSDNNPVSAESIRRSVLSFYRVYQDEVAKEKERLLQGILDKIYEEAQTVGPADSEVSRER